MCEHRRVTGMCDYRRVSSATGDIIGDRDPCRPAVESVTGLRAGVVECISVNEVSKDTGGLAAGRRCRSGGVVVAEESSSSQQSAIVVAPLLLSESAKL